MLTMALHINGRQVDVDACQHESLAEVLRERLGLRGTKVGCDSGECGACTVIIRGEAVRSCTRAVSTAQNVDITTLEGLSKGGTLHPVQQAWVDEQVPQCGYCQNGQMLTAKVLLDKNPNPTDAQIRQGMNGVLCRCMTYFRIQAAIKRAAGTMRAGDTPSTPEVIA